MKQQQYGWLQGAAFRGQPSGPSEASAPNPWVDITGLQQVDAAGRH